MRSPLRSTSWGETKSIVTEQRDENPFASLMGERLSSITFVMDYVQFNFDTRTLTAIIQPVVTVGGRSFRSGEQDYRDALCERISATVVAVSLTAEETLIQLDAGSTLVISNRVEDAVGPESAYLHDADGTVWVQRPGEWL